MGKRKLLKQGKGLTDNYISLEKMLVGAKGGYPLRNCRRLWMVKVKVSLFKVGKPRKDQTWKGRKGVR